MRDSECRAIVARLAASWPRVAWSQDNLDAYVSALHDLDAGELAAAVERARRSATYLPAIGELRRMVAEARLGAPGPAQAFRDASTVVARHPLVRQARALVGDDWHWKTAEARALRAPFERAYREVLDAAVAEITAGELSAGRRELEAAAS